MPTPSTPVHPGQIWEDVDPRGRRRFRVIEITDGRVLVETLGTSRRTRIRLERFRPTATGYRLIEQSPETLGAVSMLSVLTTALAARGYQCLEQDARGGIWTHPSWDGGRDRMLIAVRDCLDREAELATPSQD